MNFLKQATLAVACLFSFSNPISNPERTNQLLKALQVT
jgi:hypothetical protein